MAKPAFVPTALETELISVLKMKPYNGTSDRQEFLGRMASKLALLDDETWSTGLSPEAQSFTNEVAQARNAKQAIPDFPVEDVAVEEGGEGEEPEAEAEAAEVEAPAAPKGKGGARGAAGKQPPKVVSKPPAKAKAVPAPASTPTIDGVKNRIKKIVFENPNFTADQVYDALVAAGEAPSRMTVSGIRAEFRHSLKFLDSIGALVAPFSTQKRAA